MATLINPILFSQRFNVSPTSLSAAGLLDPILNSDTKLFVDPLLLPYSTVPEIKGAAFDLLKSRFDEIVRLMDACQRVGDPAWRASQKKLNLNERPETGLGYGGASTSGASRPPELKARVLKTLKEIIELGEKDPQIISLMGMFEDGVGPDTISDLTTNIILPVLCDLTERFCASENVPLQKFDNYNAHLPENPLRPGSPVILVPQDILRELPLAADWSDVSRVVSEIEQIRDAFNEFVAPLAQATLSKKKKALKELSLKSLSDFKIVFETILASSDNYDPNDDVLNFYNFRQILRSDLTPYEGKISKQTAPTKIELARIVREIVDHFKYAIENNNMWELLWVGAKPKRERAAQLLFFAVADVFCKANNIDISPESHSGGGPVDFKFSTGYRNRIVVEIKRSLGTVEHGYKTQTEIYKKAARTDEAIFIIIDVGKLGGKLARIKDWQKLKIEAGETVSEIIVVDAKQKASASKREEDE